MKTLREKLEKILRSYSYTGLFPKELLDEEMLDEIMPVMEEEMRK